VDEITWAKEVLSDAYKTSQIALLSKTPYSTIHKINTDKGELFLKINNDVFNYEHKICEYLYRKFPRQTLKILFSSDSLNCFITPYTGIPLSEYFKTNPDYAAIETALMNYANIQQNVEINHLKNLNIRDLSFQKLENKFFSSFSVDRSYLAKDKIEKIFLLRDKINEAVSDVVEFGVRDALEHGDFHFGNMLFNNGEVIYIDWAEATISNPLFSLCSFNNSLTRRLGLQRGSDFAKSMNRKYLNSFAEFYNTSYASMEQAFSLSEKIYSAYYIITLLGILAFDETQTKWQERINGSLDKMIVDFS
jgi:thiamine kinase-like enzyme